MAAQYACGRHAHRRGGTEKVQNSGEAGIDIAEVAGKEYAGKGGIGRDNTAQRGKPGRDGVALIAGGHGGLNYKRDDIIRRERAYEPAQIYRPADEGIARGALLAHEALYEKQHAQACREADIRLINAEGKGQQHNARKAAPPPAAMEKIHGGDCAEDGQRVGRGGEHIAEVPRERREGR